MTNEVDSLQVLEGNKQIVFSAVIAHIVIVHWEWIAHADSTVYWHMLSAIFSSES